MGYLTSADIKIDELNLLVKGYYEEATPGDDITAPTRSSFEVQEIVFKGLDVIDLIHAGGLIKKVEELSIENIEDK